MMTKEYADRSDKLNDQNKVGVVLGMFIPPVERYEVGFIQGVKRVNPDCEVLSVTAGSFTDQAKGKESAIAMINKGADIVFHAAGLTGVGVIQAAKEQGKLAIGVDVDQNHLAPNTVITSAEKKIPRTVYLAVKEVVDGNFQAGVETFGLEQGGVGISPFHSFEDVVPQAVKDELDKARQEILNDEVDVKATRKAIGR
jgi:basic membrane protein A